MIEAIALSSIAGLAAGAAGSWVSLRTAARREAEALDDKLRAVRAERDAARRAAAGAGAEMARLRALFELPEAPPRTEANGAWAPFAAHAEHALARLGRDALANVSAVGSATTALPIARDGADERSARLYVAAGVVLASAGEAIAREFAPELPGWPAGAARAAQVSVDVADEMNIRVARLDGDENGLLLVSIGPSGRLSEAAWGRALVALRREETRAPRAARPIRAAFAASPDGAILPRALTAALGRAGVSSVRFVAPDEQQTWETLAAEGLRRVPGAEGARVLFRVRLEHAPDAEVVALRLGHTGWVVATRDAAGPDPARLLDQVAGYLRFRDRAMAAAV